MAARRVAVLRTTPETVVADYGRLLRLAEYDRVLPRDGEVLLKLNLSWTKYFPACSTQPWQLEGIVRTLLEDGYRPERLHPVENKTVVTNPRQGAAEQPLAADPRPLRAAVHPPARGGVDRLPLPEPAPQAEPHLPGGDRDPQDVRRGERLHVPTVKCVHPDTEVLLADGSLVRAEALVKELQVREPARDLRMAIA